MKMNGSWIGVRVASAERSGKIAGASLSKWIDAYRRVATSFVEAHKAGRHMFAFAETLARAVFDDLMVVKETGYANDPGGSYYMDGRSVIVDQPDIWCVGGGYKGGIPLPIEEVDNEGDVMAAVQLLREEISYMQATTDDEIVFGWWVSDGLCYFDVTNLVEGKDVALQLGRERGEDSIYEPYTDTTLKCARRSMSKAEREAFGRSYARWNARNMRARNARKARGER